jgi:two-component system response regulator RpfG
MTWAAEPDSVPQGDDGLATVIVYHSSEDEARRLAAILSDAHFCVAQSSTPTALESQCERERADIVLIDIRPGEESDFEVCRRLMERPAGRDVSAILMVSAGRSDDLEKACAAGAAEVLLKPVHRVELVRRVSNVARLARLRGELRTLKARLARDGTTTEEAPKRDRDKQGGPEAVSG